VSEQDGDVSGSEPQAATGDRGLFGPGSVTWRIMGEPIMWVAGFRALYMQALHPRVMRGTWQNTSFARPGEAWGRFVRTTEFFMVRTHGTMARGARAGRRVRKIHSSLTGTDADGCRFRLDEPELLLWVHCGEISSYVDIARRSGVRVSARQLDEFVKEQRRSAAVIGLDPATVPASVAELDAYYERMRPRVYACPEARKALWRSYNPDLPLPLVGLKLVVPPFNTLAFASLPRWARRMYGAPGSPLTDVAATAALRVTHQSATRIPRQLLYLPAARAAHRRERERERAAA
jgi:uncharacterized protein (DUF2236 family)